MEGRGVGNNSKTEKTFKEDVRKQEHEQCPLFPTTQSILS